MENVQYLSECAVLMLFDLLGAKASTNDFTWEMKQSASEEVKYEQFAVMTSSARKARVLILAPNTSTKDFPKKPGVRTDTLTRKPGVRKRFDQLGAKASTKGFTCKMMESERDTGCSQEI